MSKALDISSATTQLTPAPLKTLQFFQIQVSENLQLIKKTWKPYWKSEKRPYMFPKVINKPGALENLMGGMRKYMWGA